MLISHVPDSVGGAGEGRAEGEDQHDHSHEYQTASELFELMAKNQNFNSSDVESLTTRDLVLLYKNIDLGTKLMTDANDFKLAKPNQYVETVVYNEDPESDCSDISEVYSSEDLHNVVLINKERIDLLTQPSLENTLCHKLGDLEIQSSELNTEYDKHFLFKDPYIKEQLKSLNLITNSNEFEGTMLPASLLDYICCKRLEDNYNFYMDNIIRYVKHTIEQLKRISNGDYLTDKAKEKWREVESSQDIDDSSNTKILATSTSIPLHVEHKAGGLLSTWDDLVHSEVDVRSLSKILEKKIILEVPKLICGSYKLLSKCCAENVIISCQKERLPVEKANAGSRVNVVFQLQRSNSGQVVSNISSIMILQTTTTQSDSLIPDSLPLTYEVPTKTNIPENNMKIIELENDQNISNIKPSPPNKEIFNYKDYTSDDLGTDESFLDSIDYPCSEYGNISHVDHSCQDSSASSYALREMIDKRVVQNEASFSVVSPDELRISMQRLNMQSALPEESGDDLSPTAMKKKSATRVRIKSPYENKSHVIEEKKRRKLLEIRDRREKKKMALAENCKITKHKFAKSAIMPQPSSSVTKLSITNKSFYNSIYGQSTNLDKQGKGKNRKGFKKDVLEIEAGDTEGDSEPVTPDLNSKKYINRSYYLDDAVTEMMYMEMKSSEKKEETFSASTSEVSNDFRANLSLLSQLIGPSVIDFGDVKDPEIKIEAKPERFMDSVCTEDINGNHSRGLASSQSINNMVPSTAPSADAHDIIDPKKSSSSVECRRSIDKIYNLMNKLGKQRQDNKTVHVLSPETKPSKIRLPADIEKFNIAGGRGSSTIQGSDSGTSLKHHLVSSNPSCFSFENNGTNGGKVPITQNTQTDTPTAVVPKVIISSKSHIPKLDVEKNKKDYKKFVINNPTKVPDNPLQAISQLLQEFENVQKIRQKSAVEQKRKSDPVSTDPKNMSRQNSTKRRSRLEQHIKESAVQKDKSPKSAALPKKPRPPLEVQRSVFQPTLMDDKHIDKITKKKIVDIIDEVKEARGEAVRGPSKINSRLNSLAQPKRSYVQAHSEEYQFKYGKTLMADRLQRLAASQPPAAVDKNLPQSAKSRVKRGPEPVSTVSVKVPSPAVPPIERGARLRGSTSSGPVETSALTPGRGPSSKQNNVPDTPETLKKMVAVESYVKSHFGCPAGVAAMSGPLHSAHMSRVPLLPIDLELVSLTSSPSPTEEATTLGSKLHRIIDTMINTTSHGLGVLTECPESNSKIIKDNTDDNSLTDTLSRCDEHISTDSEYNVDIFEDKNVHTAVENVENVTRKSIYEDIEEENDSNHDVQMNSATQLETLENALYRRMSVGTFHKRLRIKKLTLSPKQSMQQVVLLQSGDAGSLVIKSTVPPPSLKIGGTKNVNLQHLKALPVLATSQLDWGFAKFPMQVATVGYAFPQYQSVPFRPKTIKLLDEVSISLEKKASEECQVKNDKDSQCFKGDHRPRLQQVAQTVEPKHVLPEVTNIIHAAPVESEEENLEMIAADINKNAEVNSIAQSVAKEVSELSSIDETSPTITADSKTVDVPQNSEVIDYTTSLDVLVGLLNEIQTITTCQTHMTAPSEHNTSNPDCKELETILSNAAATENSVHSSPQEIVSITSLEKLRQLESNPSIYSFYLSDDEDQHRCFSTINLHAELPRSIHVPCTKPACVDKQVGVDLFEREYVNTFTDVPSRFLPVGVNHSTNVTSSLIGVISEPSTQSLFSFAEYHTVFSKASALNPHKNIIELQIATEKLPEPANQNEVEIENVNVGEQLVNKKIEVIAKGAIIEKKLKLHLNHSKRCLLASDMDPIMKRKRDVLVTVYSLLVFTVFAALSFPEVWYHF